MKKLLLLMLCLLLTMPLAQSESAYPACQGTVTDLANVLTESTMQDLDKLSTRYENALGGKLYVITRHFLGGKDVKTYTQSLFEAWGLNEYDALLMMVIGEESYALQLGHEAQKALPDEMAASYLGSYFHTDFLARRYDTAASRFLTQAAQRIAAFNGKTISISGLFGAEKDAKSPADYVQDLSSMFSTLLTSDTSEDKDDSSPILQENKTSGISIWKILLVIIILRTIFGKKKKRRYNFGHTPRR